MSDHLLFLVLACGGFAVLAVPVAIVFGVLFHFSRR